MDPKTYRYESRRPDDAGIRKRLRELAEQRRRFGYRRLHILLAREGIRLNHKKLYRIYREERLTVRKRGARHACPVTLPPSSHQFSDSRSGTRRLLRHIAQTGASQGAVVGR